jgi:hypothetical protein
MVRSRIAGVLVGLVFVTLPARADRKPWEPDSLWFGLAGELPVTLHLNVAELSISNPTESIGLLVPLLTLGVDLKGPAQRRRSISLSFAQAPVVGFLAGFGLASRSRVAQAMASALLWLSGGTLRWAPGGLGNLHLDELHATTLSFVLKQELAIHPFAGPLYFRDTVGVGVTVRWDGPYGEPHPWRIPHYLCGVGVFASGAAEPYGARAFTPGMWASCATLLPWD